MTQPGSHMATVLAVGALIAVTGVAGAPSASAATTLRPNARAASPSCSLASAARVKSALGVTVAPPTVTKNQTVTVCQFMTTSGLLVRFETNETMALFAFGRKGFDKNGRPTRTMTGLGTKAYSSTKGKQNTVVVLQGTTELLVLGNVSQAKLVALAKLILPSL